MKVPKTPHEFDYDLWTTEDGKCMVRVKCTGEECEVDRETMRLLRAEEKRLRREMQGVPLAGSRASDEDARASILSLDFVSIEGGDELSPAWLEDPVNIEQEVLTQMLENEFAASLTPTQFSVYKHCLLGGMSFREYARRKSVDCSSVRETNRQIRKKFEKLFGHPPQNGF